MSDQGAPSWTDQNQSDPGVTILEVLAYSLSALGLAAATFAVVRRRRRIGND